MFINAFNQKNIVNKASNEIINKILLNIEVPKHLSKIFQEELLKID